MGAPRGRRNREATGFSWDGTHGLARCNIYLPGHGGRKRKRITIHAASKDEALAKWLAFRRKYTADGGHPDEIPTLQEFIDSRFDELTAGLRPSTVEGYRSMLRSRVLPEFGSFRLNEITSGRVNAWIDRLQLARNQKNPKKKLSAATINGAVNVLKLVLGKALARDELTESPFRRPIERLKPKKPAQELSDEERRAFLAAFDDDRAFHAWIGRTKPRGTKHRVDAENDPFGGQRRHGASLRAGSEASQLYYDRFRSLKPFFVCLLELGLRRGDALELRWTEVDLTAGFVRLKTRKREVDVVLPISRVCREALQECRSRPVVADRVFLTEDGHPLSEIRVRRSFRIAKTLAGITRPVRVHDLRHSFASRLVTDGASLTVVGALLGHTDVRSTSRYARAEKTAAAEVARAILDGG